MAQDLPIGVIGGGLGGLAAACTLAARGHEVILFEKNAWLGGKAAVLEEAGFRFDMGPTILTVPRVLARIFGEAGRRLEDELDLVRLDPQWRCFFEDGSTLDLREDIAAMQQELERFAPGDHCAKGYAEFLQVSQRLHEVSERFFFWKPVESLRDTMDLRRNLSAATLADVLSLRMGATVAGTVRRKVHDARVAQMLDHFIQYVGSSPYGAPAVLCAIAHMQVGDGVWYPMGGTRAVPAALARLAEALGVTFRTGTDVRRLLIEGGRVRGLETADGERIALGAVVSNMDSVRTYQELVGGAPAASFARGRPSRAGLLGRRSLPRPRSRLRAPAAPQLRLLARRRGGVRLDLPPRRACPGPDLLSRRAGAHGARCGAARRRGALRPRAHALTSVRTTTGVPCCRATGAIILDKLARTAGMRDLERRIVVERALTPQDIHERYRVLNGAIYGLASHGRLLGAFKPGNRSRQVGGLYLAGGAAHPGPGMPMVLMSGWIAADALDQDLRQRTAA